MKLRPILFQTAMVQAILAGAKTQTRRKIKPKIGNGSYDIVTMKDGTFVEVQAKNEEEEHIGRVDCPYGEIGDVLWVRETFMKYHPVKEDGNVDTSSLIYKYAADKPERVYALDGDGWQMHNADGSEKLVPFKPSIHMPFEAARLFLKITNIRVERLQDITEADAVAEGFSVESYMQNHEAIVGYPAAKWAAMQAEFTGEDADVIECCPVSWYAWLWQKINGPESWDANPFVWVVEFERTEKPV